MKEDERFFFFFSLFLFSFSFPFLSFFLSFVCVCMYVLHNFFLFVLSWWRNLVMELLVHAVLSMFLLRMFHTARTWNWWKSIRSIMSFMEMISLSMQTERTLMKKSSTLAYSSTAFYFPCCFLFLCVFILPLFVLLFSLNAKHWDLSTPFFISSVFIPSPLQHITISSFPHTHSLPLITISFLHHIIVLPVQSGPAHGGREHDRPHPAHPRPARRHALPRREAQHVHRTAHRGVLRRQKRQKGMTDDARRTLTLSCYRCFCFVLFCVVLLIGYSLIVFALVLLFDVCTLGIGLFISIILTIKCLFICSISPICFLG